MELAGEQLILSPRQVVWDALNDPAVLSRCVPGCEELVKVSDSEMHARVAIKIGPVRARFAGKIFRSEVEAPARCTLSFEGSGGAAGFARGSSAVQLLEEEGGTRLRYTVEAAVGGKLGQIGGRLIDSSAKKMADEFFTAFEASLRDAGGLAQAPVAAAPAASAAPSPAALHPAAPAATVFAPQGAASGAMRHELQRLFWFATGVVFTMLTTRWLP